MKIFSLRFCISFTCSISGPDLIWVDESKEAEKMFSANEKVSLAIKSKVSGEWLAAILKNPIFQQKAHHLFLVFENEKELADAWEALQKQFGKIEAAGGVVVNPQNEILIIHRKGWLDLPKGKLDQGETMSECAMREVAEETGLISHTLGNALKTTFHVYEDRKKGWVIKSSYWFLMFAAGNENLVPQTEEDITAIEWMQKEKLKEKNAEMYPLINDVLADALSSLN